MEKTKTQLIKNLFPDKRVRDVVTKVVKNDEAFAESMLTDYSLLNHKKEVVMSTSHQPCFGQLYGNFSGRSSLTDKSKRAVYLKYKTIYSSKCTKKIRYRWIELGQELGILDDELSIEHIYENGLLFDMTDKKLTLGELYFTLTFMRWLREAPILVNNVITLVDDAGRDFWAAVAFCHGTNVSRVDHSLLPFSRGYAVGGNKNDIEKDLGLVMRLHEIAASPRASDKRTIQVHLKESKGFTWKWQSQVVKPKLNLVLEDRLMLLSSDVLPLIYTGNVKKSIKMSKELKRSKSYVKFK